MRYDFNLESRKDNKKLLFQIIITIVEMAVIIGIAYAITHYGLETFTQSNKPFKEFTQFINKFIKYFFALSLII